MIRKQSKTRRASPRPTAGELAILRVLWERGACTVRDVHEQLNPDGKNSYTTTLKLMQIMHDKALVVRDAKQRAHIYEAVSTQQQEQQAFVTDLAQRLFNGSPTRLAVQALGQTGTIDADELAAIKSLIERLENQHEE